MPYLGWQEIVNIHYEQINSPYGGQSDKGQNEQQ